MSGIGEEPYDFDHGPDGEPYLGRYAAWRRARQLRKIANTRPIAVRVNIKLRYDGPSWQIMLANGGVRRRIEKTFKGLVVKDLRVVWRSTAVDGMLCVWEDHLLCATFVVS